MIYLIGIALWLTLGTVVAVVLTRCFSRAAEFNDKLAVDREIALLELQFEETQ